MSGLLDRIADRVRRNDYRQWREKVIATGGCMAPIRMTGSRTITNTATGDILSTTGGDILVACGNRRSSVCEVCSKRYAADAFHLIRAGLTGGAKNIPTSVAARPRAFVTLTAPSFGPVHNRPTTRTGTVRACACGEHHHIDDPRVGTAIDPDTYDYTGHVLWQAHSGKLWHRFTIRLSRVIARAVGLKVREITERFRVSYAKVAEYQRRGIVHFHAVIRLDGPDGAHSPAPAWATTDLLTDAVVQAARDVDLDTVRPDGQPLTLHWGRQVDVRVVTATTDSPDDQALTDTALAGYIAKYSTKGSGKSEATDRPVRSEHHLEHLTVTDHHRRIMRVCWTLGDHPRYASLNLRKWTHMLGFRGHFLTKSQRYSTTFSVIRGERRAHQTLEHITRLGHNPETVTVVNHWAHTGTGHHNDAERELAAGIANAHHTRRQPR